MLCSYTGLWDPPSFFPLSSKVDVHKNWTKVYLFTHRTKPRLCFRGKSLVLSSKCSFIYRNPLSILGELDGEEENEECWRERNREAHLLSSEKLLEGRVRATELRVFGWPARLLWIPYPQHGVLTVIFGLTALYPMILLLTGLELYPVSHSWAQTLAYYRGSLQKPCLPHNVHFQPLAHSSINRFPPYQASLGIPTCSDFRELSQRCLSSLEYKRGNAIQAPTVCKWPRGIHFSPLTSSELIGGNVEQY